MFGALMVGGYFQGMEWAKWAQPPLLVGETPLYSDYQRQMALKPFIETIKDLLPWWSARGVSGLVLLVANGLFLFNIAQTLLASPRRDSFQGLMRGRPFVANKNLMSIKRASNSPEAL